GGGNGPWAATGHGADRRRRRPRARRLPVRDWPRSGAPAGDHRRLRDGGRRPAGPGRRTASHDHGAYPAARDAAAAAPERTVADRGGRAGRAATGGRSPRRPDPGGGGGGFPGGPDRGHQPDGRAGKLRPGPHPGRRRRRARFRSRLTRRRRRLPPRPPLRPLLRAPPARHRLPGCPRLRPPRRRPATRPRSDGRIALRPARAGGGGNARFL
ncbi:MAG: hypothetical protein AVDCRST_MAG19-4545, partial [uncultured Thermomicrobiales bacterium]